VFNRLISFNFGAAIAIITLSILRQLNTVHVINAESLSIILAISALGIFIGNTIPKFKLSALKSTLIQTIFLVFTCNSISYRFVTWFFSQSKILGLNTKLSLFLYALVCVFPIYIFVGKISKKHSDHAFKLGFCLALPITAFIGFALFGVNESIMFAGALLILSLFLQRVHIFNLIYLITFPILFYQLLYVDWNYNIKSNAHTTSYIIKRFNIATQKQVGKLYVSNNTPQSFLDKQQHAFNYIQTIKSLLFDELKLEHKDILVLGAGGFTLASERLSNNYIWVDIDPDLYKNISEEFRRNIPGEFVNSDARQYLANTNKKFDVIVMDVFGANFTIPAHLLTAEYFTMLRSKLKNDGLVLMNIIMNPYLSDSYSMHLYNTVMHTFNACMVIPEKNIDKRNNVLFSCVNKPYDNIVYVDNNSGASVESLG